MAHLSRLAHLAARLVDVVLSRRLTPIEQAEVAEHLASPAERAMFWEQPRADQRHGLASARAVAARCPDRGDLIRAALLHDIGKRHARLGAPGRSWVAVCSVMGLPLSARMAGYLDHGRSAAGELSAAGAEALVVAYALHHHGRRPDGISAEDWEVLEKADRARLPVPAPIRRLQRPRTTRSRTYDGVSPAGEATNDEL